LELQSESFKAVRFLDEQQWYGVNVVDWVSPPYLNIKRKDGYGIAMVRLDKQSVG